MKLYTDEHHTRVSTMRHEEDDKEVELTTEEWDEIMNAENNKIAETILNILDNKK